MIRKLSVIKKQVEFLPQLEDMLLPGLTFQELLDTVVSNEPLRDEKAFQKVFNEILNANLRVARSELKSKMPWLLKQLPKEK